jgi:hypothetical protein
VSCSNDGLTTGTGSGTAVGISCRDRFGIPKIVLGNLLPTNPETPTANGKLLISCLQPKLYRRSFNNGLACGIIKFLSFLFSDLFISC